MKSLRGYVLAASPGMTDPSFERTVILVVQHDRRGAVGVVLNRPADRATYELWEGIAHKVGGKAAEVRIGGPVPGPVFAFGLNSQTGSMPTPAEVASGRGRLPGRLGDSQNYRVFLGCAGWEGGQLEEEIRQGDWLLAPATLDHVFGSAEDLWRAVVQQVGSSILRQLGIKHFPADPRLN